MVVVAHIFVYFQSNYWELPFFVTQNKQKILSQAQVKKDISMKINEWMKKTSW